LRLDGSVAGRQVGYGVSFSLSDRLWRTGGRNLDKDDRGAVRAVHRLRLSGRTRPSAGCDLIAGRSACIHADASREGFTPRQPALTGNGGE
jgi:hypothetical protein